VKVVNQELIVSTYSYLSNTTPCKHLSCYTPNTSNSNHSHCIVSNPLQN